MSNSIKMATSSTMTTQITAPENNPQFFEKTGDIFITGVKQDSIKVQKRNVVI